MEDITRRRSTVAPGRCDGPKVRTHLIQSRTYADDHPGGRRPDCGRDRSARSTSWRPASRPSRATSRARTPSFAWMPTGARAAARRVDAERARGIDRGPLHGIPISLKDLIDVAGEVTTAASRVLADRVAPADAPVVTRLREAGAIILGKTNLHEFALGTTSEDSAFGAVHHPLDPSRSAGGSSGGSAAAVACGMGLASVGTDTGGSIRIPAAACGVVGLKPSLGDVPTDGVIPLEHVVRSRRAAGALGRMTRRCSGQCWRRRPAPDFDPAAARRPLPAGTPARLLRCADRAGRARRRSTRRSIAWCGAGADGDRRRTAVSPRHPRGLRQRRRCPKARPGTPGISTRAAATTRRSSARVSRAGARFPP